MKLVIIWVLNMTRMVVVNLVSSCQRLAVPKSLTWIKSLVLAVFKPSMVELIMSGYSGSKIVSKIDLKETKIKTFQSVVIKLLKVRLGSVADPAIQATGRSEFEDVLGSGDFVSGYSYHMSVRTGLPDHTIQTKFQSHANGLVMMKHLFPLFEYRS
jgi:hypothetical protein